MSAAKDGEASFESILDNLQQVEEEERASLAEQKGAGDLLCDAEGSVAFQAGAEAAMPIVDSFSIRGRYPPAVQQYTRVVWAFL
jgi:hypothetical protein